MTYEEVLGMQAWIADESVVGGGSTMAQPLNTLVNGCELLIQAEQEELLPDNTLISVLCDAVRLARAYTELQLELLALRSKSAEDVLRIRVPRPSATDPMLPDEQCVVDILGFATEASRDPSPETVMRTFAQARARLEVYVRDELDRRRQSS